jgi:hypothetical protein
LNHRRHQQRQGRDICPVRFQIDIIPDPSLPGVIPEHNGEPVTDLARLADYFVERCRDGQFLGDEHFLDLPIARAIVFQVDALDCRLSLRHHAEADPIRRKNDIGLTHGGNREQATGPGIWSKANADCLDIGTREFAGV